MCIKQLTDTVPVILTFSPFGQQTCSVALWNQLCLLSGPAVVLHCSVISSPLFSVTLLIGLILENPSGDTSNINENYNTDLIAQVLYTS